MGLGQAPLTSWGQSCPTVIDKAQLLNRPHHTLSLPMGVGLAWFPGNRINTKAIVLQGWGGEAWGRSECFVQLVLKHVKSVVGLLEGQKY